ncbi:Valine--tRNA ligase [Candidatus Desulfarcum epimagneticum]|uniref:Valine--tRNA ligase n=1 Tax=uncultured Desulfobacteraceae bacterium TaxID=218296 RepID=A0A484HKV9_9BACT|nr:Valine--tRNA ligase [uncultured Desulfobacteraceae bacterium]
MSSNLPDKGYEPHDVEKRWREKWEESRLFSADETSEKPAYSIVIPPPNVTGVLHMGHALNNTMQDILCRHRRLKGDNVLWMPGTDHAGIATQNVVERSLAEKNTDRHELGREKFIEAVWEWREKFGGAIVNQLKHMGASCDWERERFTMDQGLSEAVRTVFARLYHEGLIYRGNYIINWCPRCRTALADLEVEHEETDGALYHIEYPFPDGPGGIVVATTRPETMFGDTAVAVHPDDERHRDLPAEEVILPLAGRRIPVIRDEYVDMSFGTGGLKVTPAHDPNDFEIGRRHGLEELKVIDDDGKMMAGAGRFEGMDRFECRKAALEELKAVGALKKTEPHDHSVGRCYRCRTVVEPNLSRQWFVKAKPLAEKAAQAVRDGRTRIIPKTWEKTYFDWMDNIRDWCVSRQIWWGHRIPAWTCGECGETIVEAETPSSCPRCESASLEQESDVLDTWFSSALWPFSTMGWPHETPLLKTFYPTSVLVTGFDILFFWVARMMMMGIHFMGDVPFRDVYVHALVRDEEGKKMSKSKGNVIDPLSVIERHGTDAFRFTLAAFAAQGRDIKMSEKRVEGYRHFVNKLWNAARFVLMNMDRDGAESEMETDALLEKMSLTDRWITLRLYETAARVSEALDQLRFNDAASALYQFVWHEFCDWHLEAVKPALYGDDPDAKKTATAVLFSTLKAIVTMLHPFMPFVTEEIWDKMSDSKGFLIHERFPEPPSPIPGALTEAGREMDAVMDVITAVRNIRGEMNISPGVPLKALVCARDSFFEKTLLKRRDMALNLARLKSLEVKKGEVEKPPKSASAEIKGAALFVFLEGAVDFSKEAARLEKEIKKLEREMAVHSAKLDNEKFLARAPADIVEKVRTQRGFLLEKRDRLKESLLKIQKQA